LLAFLWGSLSGGNDPSIAAARFPESSDGAVLDNVDCDEPLLVALLRALAFSHWGFTPNMSRKVNVEPAHVERPIGLLVVPLEFGVAEIARLVILIFARRRTMLRSERSVSPSRISRLRKRAT
jgi:hypothetical protein